MLRDSRRINQLMCVEFGIHTLLLDELLMGAVFDNQPFLHHEDTIRAPHGGEAMCNDNTGSPLEEAFERFLDERFGSRINTTGGFIEDEDRPVDAQCP